MKKLKVGDYVSVKMTYEDTKNFINNDGEFISEVIGERVEYVPDKILFINDIGTVVCENCGAVDISDVSVGSEGDKNTVESENNAVVDMMVSGDNLMSAIKEPEFI